MISLLDLVAQYRTIQNEIDEAIRQVLESGRFILGPNVTAFEEDVAAFLGVKYGIGVASGTDALILALRALGIGSGDEVIIPAYTFFATVGAVILVGAKPVFVDIDPLTYGIDAKQVSGRINPQTKAILPVHLYGHPVDISPLQELARSHNLKMIEDNAQAFGADYGGRKTGTLGDAGCLSFFPSKNLGAFGDGGMVVTNDEQVMERVRQLRTHGWKQKYFPEVLGYNSRLDELQAALLRVKLRYVDEWNERRRDLAYHYAQRLSGLPIILPREVSPAKHVYHLYVIRVQAREEVKQRLMKAGIASEVYYPIPPHLTAPCRSLGYQRGDFPVAEQASRETLAIPLYPEMSINDIDAVVTALEQALAP